jgi:hypothetical protein
VDEEPPGEERIRVSGWSYEPTREERRDFRKVMKAVYRQNFLKACSRLPLIGSRFRRAAEMQLPVVMDLVRAQRRCHPDRP